MKRILFPLFLLTVMLTGACNTQTPNNNYGANQNALPNLNINQGIDSDPKKKTVVITVGDDRNGKHTYSVSPDLIHLSKSKKQNLRFFVFNNTDVEFTDVTISFKAADPMVAGAYTIGRIESGTYGETKAKDIKDTTTPSNQAYKYKVVINVAGEAPILIDPEVEISN